MNRDNSKIRRSSADSAKAQATAGNVGGGGIYLGIGGNIGDRELNLTRALTIISAHPDMRLLQVSSFYRSSPWGVTEQPWFLNAICEIGTVIYPAALLEELKRIERILGREKSTERWGPRAIDLDIILFRSIVMRTPLLTIPHKHCTERLFVLMPLVEIAPGIVHPETGVSFRNYLDELLKTQPEEACLKYNQIAFKKP